MRFLRVATKSIPNIVKLNDDVLRYIRCIAENIPTASLINHFNQIWNSSLRLSPNAMSRPGSEFDAGINTSAAWTEHLYASADDDEEDKVDDVDEERRAGRVLYDFEGKAEFRELSVYAGDEVEAIKEELPDGWSLVRIVGSCEVGLLPRSYYTVCVSLLSNLNSTHFTLTCLIVYIRFRVCSS